GSALAACLLLVSRPCASSSTAVRCSCATSILASTLRLSRGSSGTHASKPTGRPHTATGLSAASWLDGPCRSRTKSGSRSCRWAPGRRSSCGRTKRRRCGPGSWRSAEQSSSCRRSGKTRLALAAMARAGSSALCLVPTRILLAQWLHHIRRTYAGPVGCYGDGAHELAALTVATFESAYRHMDRLGNRFDLLVVDEAHHFGCGLRDEAL